MAFEAVGNKITEFIESLTEVIEKSVASNFEILYGAVLPLWTAGMMTYLLYTIYQIIYGSEEISIHPFIKNLIVLALVFATLGAGGFYLKDVVPFVMNVGDDVGAAVAGQSASSMVEQILVQTGKTLTEVWDEAFDGGVFEIIGFVIIAAIQSIFIIAGGLILGIYALAYVVITKMMVGLLLSIGGVFIMLGTIPMFRSMFTNWIAACFNYIFLNIAFSVTFVMIMEVINSLVTMDSKAMEFTSLILIVVFYVIAVLMLQQVTVLVSSLTGGVGINGLTSAVNSGFGMGNSARKWAFNKRQDTSGMKGSRARALTGGIGKMSRGIKNMVTKPNNIKG